MENLCMKHLKSFSKAKTCPPISLAIAPPWSTFVKWKESVTASDAWDSTGISGHVISLIQMSFFEASQTSYWSTEEPHGSLTGKPERAVATQILPSLS